MSSEQGGSKSVSGNSVSLPVGCLREFWEYLRMVELRAIAAYDRERNQPSLPGSPNKYEGLPELCSRVRKSADFLLEATKAGPDQETLPDSKKVDLQLDVVQEWFQGLSRECARRMLGELNEAQAGHTPTHSMKCQVWVLNQATWLFCEETGLTLQDMGMVVADVVQKEEFDAFREKKLPWWLDDFCRIYHYTRAEALEASRRASDREFQEDHPDVIEALRHFDTWISWLKAKDCISYITSDSEIADDLKGLLDIMPEDVMDLDSRDFHDALQLLRALDRKWRERHGEPPQAGGKQ